MSRYEGMENLVERVRQHLQHQEEQPESTDTPPLMPPNTPQREPQYDGLLKAALVLVHDGEQLRDLLAVEPLSLTEEQRHDLRTLLGKALQSLQASQRDLS